MPAVLVPVSRRTSAQFGTACAAQRLRRRGQYRVVGVTARSRRRSERRQGRDDACGWLAEIEAIGDGRSTSSVTIWGSRSCAGRCSRRPRVVARRAATTSARRASTSWRAEHDHRVGQLRDPSTMTETAAERHAARGADRGRGHRQRGSGRRGRDIERRGRGRDHGSHRRHRRVGSRRRQLRDVGGRDRGPGVPLSQFATLVVGIARAPRRRGRDAAAWRARRLSGCRGASGSPPRSSPRRRDARRRRRARVRGRRRRREVARAPGAHAGGVEGRPRALAEMRVQGYRTTTVRLSIDGLGFVRRTQTVVRFADGGSVDCRREVLRLRVLPGRDAPERPLDRRRPGRTCGAP